MWFTFDTNILVYAADRTAGRRHDIAKDLLGRAHEPNCVLTLQSLGEFFFATTRKGKLSLAEATALTGVWQALFPVVAADRAAFADAQEAVRDHRLPFWDAMLRATARRAGCRLIVTEDFQDGRELGGVWFVNPFGDTLPPRLEAVLQPNG